MNTHTLNEILPVFMTRVNQMVWCNAATIDTQGRPRSRILHPLWEGPVAWITADPTSLKTRHLATHPYMSLAYASDVAKPAYADCHAAWVDDPDIRQHVWNLCQETPPPMGFDPEPIYGAIDPPVAGRSRFGVLRLEPYRIVLTQWPEPLWQWSAERSGTA
ncbi:MAG: hypothetical protein U0031_20695 [Thermomicrobiales bacterium]